MEIAIVKQHGGDSPWYDKGIPNGKTVMIFFTLLNIFTVCVLVLVIIPALILQSSFIHRIYALSLLSIFQNLCSSEERKEKVDDSCALTDNLESTHSLEAIEKIKSKSLHLKLHDEHVELSESSKFSKLLSDDAFDFIVAGVEAVIDDEVTRNFRAEKLSSWNLLTRTKFQYTHISWKLGGLWCLGFFFRYLVLLPIRITILCIGIVFLSASISIISLIQDERLKANISKYAMILSARIISRAFSTIVRFHDRENRALNGGICVANHTSPTDVLILSCDNSYAMVGQRQGGILGIVQRMLSHAADNVWFERTEMSDRKKVIDRLKAHAEDPQMLPILIFPEGTCINNTSVLMFKKGSFEIGATVYPIAIKYDLRLGDAFWNSSEQSYGVYLFEMMTSWAIMCDVWYLPPVNIMGNESSIDFARRVKHSIAEKGGLVDLEWDGQLKRMKVPPKLVVSQQNLYWESLSRRVLFEDINDDDNNRNADSDVC